MTLDRLWAGWRSRYVSEEAGRDDRACFLCALDALADAEAISAESLLLERTPLTLTVMNLYPYNSGHVLIAPRRHEPELEALTDEEGRALMHAQQRAVCAVKVAYACDGINIGINLGRAAGAGVPGHLHAHVLPRWGGDTNFMTSVAEARVIPEALEIGWAKLRDVWPEAG